MSIFPSNVRFLSTPRCIYGGNSIDNFNNFNLALHVNDENSAVLANRSLLENHYNLPSKPIWINQTHSNVSINADSISTIVNADASYSKKIGTVCGILTADCLPVFVSNKKGTNSFKAVLDDIISHLFFLPNLHDPISKLLPPDDDKDAI